VQKTDGNGNVATFEYDAASQLLRKAFSDGTGVRFSHDAAGNRTAAANQHLTLSYTYDELNRVTSVTDSRFQKTIRYSYDRLGRRTATTDPEGGVTSYAWDANRRLTSITAPSGASVAFGYDALGRLTSLNSTTLKYDAAGRLLELARAGETLAYAYDGAGNRTAVAGAAGAHSYQYDALDRLIGAQHQTLPAETYTYDAAGNRTGSAADPAYKYDAAGRLVAAESASFTYDRNGNLTSRTTVRGKTTYTWDVENGLAKVDFPDGGVVTYKYDPFGRRIEKNVNGAVTTYLYDGNAILMEMDGAGQVTARYTHGPVVDWPLMMEREGQTFFYHADALRSVAALTDSSGNVVRSYAYDSWGRPQATEAAGPANPFLFAGREYDVETGLYYMRARYYDPAVGRFISSDPLDIAGLLLTAQDPAAGFAVLPASAVVLASDVGTGLLRAPQQLNPYSYALNNPIALRDPSGLQPCTPWQRFQQAENEWSSQFEQQLKGSMQLEADQWTEWWQSFKEAYKESFKTDWSKMGPSEHLREILKFLKTGGTGRAGR
jgi:RHS repeat-associated protein